MRAMPGAGSAMRARRMRPRFSPSSDLDSRKKIGNLVKTIPEISQKPSKIPVI